jgi:DUF4097 and DUF4098 domain-containing protein YvlB
MMKQKVKYALFILLFMFSLLAAEDNEQKIVRRFDMTSTGSIELANVNGKIEITTSATAAIDVKAVKKSDDKGEIETVDVIFDLQNNHLTVTTKYNKKNTKAKVNYMVTIPEKLSRAVFKSVNGAVDCRGKFQKMIIKTVNGKIDCSGGFAVGSFETVNGAINISQEAALSGDLKAETVNGAIDIELNHKSAFIMESSTVNGDIDSDFPISVQHHFFGSSLKGQVNGGGHKISLETINGRIRISKI